MLNDPIGKNVGGMNITYRRNVYKFIFLIKSWWFFATFYLNKMPLYVYDSTKLALTLKLKVTYLTTANCSILL